MPTRTRVKFCGICREVDALSAVDLGVDALGFVFYRKSPRYVEVAAASDIIAALPPLIMTVGLFVDADLEWVEQVVTATRIDLIQYHGAESGAACRAGPRPYIKAIRVDSGFDFAVPLAEYAQARAVLLDAYHPQLHGGTGQPFDWSLIPKHCAKPVILAGGLTVDNVAAAIAQVRPYAVDVSGGIESSKGVKDLKKMRDFMAEVHRVERDIESS